MPRAWTIAAIIRIYWYRDAAALPADHPDASVMFNFVGSWNGFLLPLIVLNTDSLYTGRWASCSSRDSTAPIGRASTWPMRI